jgi:hypothetical protein
MKEAINEWRAKGIQEFERLVRTEQVWFFQSPILPIFSVYFQDELIKELCNNDTQQTTASSSQSNQQAAKSVHCRFCDTFLCKGSSLRLQGTTVVCVGPAFEQLVKPPKTAGGNKDSIIKIDIQIFVLAKFVCPNSACHRELGGVVLLLRNTPAYALQITAVKFFMNDEKEPRLFKKWSLYQGYMKPL